MANLPFHPLAEKFPLILGKEFVELKEDIKENGLLDPIVMYEGQILDGRNRFRACQETGVEPTFCDYGGDQPARYVLSLNLHRRHMTPSQLATVAVEFLPELEKEAKTRQGTRTDLGTISTQSVEAPKPVRATAVAAELTGASQTYVKEAKALKAEAPGVFEEVKAGTISLPEAKRKSQGISQGGEPQKTIKKNRPDTQRATDAIHALAGCWDSGENIYKKATKKQKVLIDGEVRAALTRLNDIYEASK